MAFALIGLGNTALYLIIFNVVFSIGAVKANVIATVVTTTLSYLANRHWTYRSRPKSTLRREYTLFFAFNLAGMVIQSGVVAAAKYGLDLSEDRHRIALNLATCIGIGMATAFRFWAYRTLVFRPHPADHALPTSAAEALAEVFEEEAEFSQLTAPLEAELGDTSEAALSADAVAGRPPR
jgi:putative flippase GtrA